MSDNMKRIFSELIRDKGSKDDLPRFWITTDKLDRDNEIIDPKGLDVKNYKETGLPVLYGHDAGKFPVGKGVSLKREKKDGKNGWTMGVEFMPKEMNEEAWKVGQMVEHGWIKTGSIRFLVKPNGYITPKDDDEWRTMFTKTELVEFSITPIPSNVEAGRVKSVDESFDEFQKSKEKTADITINAADADSFEKHVEDNGIDEQNSKFFYCQEIKMDEEGEIDISYDLNSTCWIGEYKGSGVDDGTGIDAPIKWFMDDSENIEWLPFKDYTDPENVITLSWLGDSEKAGAVLNAKNKADLKSAQTAIQRVLDSAGTEDGDEDEEDEKDLESENNALRAELEKLKEAMEGKHNINDDDVSDPPETIFDNLIGKGTLPKEGRGEKTDKSGQITIDETVVGELVKKAMLDKQKEAAGYVNIDKVFKE